MALLTWPKQRTLTDSEGDRWTATITPGGLLLTCPGVAAIEFADPDELRAFSMQAHAAAIEHDLDVQEAAVKASLERRRLRGLSGNRHRPVAERPEPPAHMSLELPA